jgi:hypothetical protein
MASRGRSGIIDSVSSFQSRGLAVPGDAGHGILVAGGLAVAGLGGIAAARGSLVILGALGWLALVVIGLRYPALPLALAAGAYVLVSTQASDNALLGGAEELHVELAGPVTAADVLVGAAAVAALASYVARPPEQRARAWSPLALPILALLGAGAVSGLVIHREGGGAVLALFPLVRLTVVFATVRMLLAAGHLTRPQILVWFVVGAEIVGALGVYNSLFGPGGGEAVISETTLPGGEAPVDERTLAFVDAASPFVMVVGLVAILGRLLWGVHRSRLLLLALAVLPFAALVLSARRAMWVDFAVASLVLVLVSASVDRRVLVGAVVGLSVAGVAFVTLTQSSPAYQERLGGIATVFSGESTEGNIRSRQIETSAVWDNIREQPLLGIGLTAPYLSNVQFQYQEPTYLHNNILWIWLKFGLLGLLAFSWLAWRTIGTGLRQSRGLFRSARTTEPEAALVAVATLVGFFVAILTASFLTASIRPPVVAAVLFALVGDSVQPLKPRTVPAE